MTSRPVDPHAEPGTTGPADRRAMFEAVAHEHRPTPDALAPCGLRCVCGMRTTAYEQHLVNVLLSRLATPDPGAALGGNRYPRSKEEK